MIPKELFEFRQERNPGRANTKWRRTEEITVFIDGEVRGREGAMSDMMREVDGLGSGFANRGRHVLGIAKEKAIGISGKALLS